MNLCRQCNQQRRNKERVLEIAEFFRPKNSYNEELFKIYLEKIMSRYIKNREPTLTKKFVEVLEREEIPVIIRWEEIYDLSEKYGLRYSGDEVRRGCPFRLIKKELGTKHNLPPRRYYSVGTLKKYLTQFDERDVPHIQKYADQLASKHKRNITTDGYIRHVIAFCKWVRPLTLLEVDKKTVELYLQDLYKVEDFWPIDRFCRLRQFYHWAESEKLIDHSPFEGLRAPSKKKRCSRCQKMKVFWHPGEVCAVCSIQDKSLIKIESLTSDIELKSDYNEHLFDLYFKYLNRSIIYGHHLDQLIRFKEYLKGSPIPTLSNWTDIKRESKLFEEYLGYSLKGSCPFMKTSRMLQELGALPIREEDYSISYETAINKLSESYRESAILYFEVLQKRKFAIRSCVTIANLFLKLERWLWENYGTCNIVNTSEPMLMNYLEQLNTVDIKIQNITTFKKFYSWTKKQRYILINPLEAIVVPKTDPPLQICSDEQINKLVKYIRAPGSDTEGAMILALILYWGLTGPELRCSTIEIVDGLLQIQLYRPKLSYGRRRHRRKEILKLPDNPSWIRGLQKRFIARWKDRYEQMEKSFLRQPLLFSKNLKSLRAIGIQMLTEKVYKATVEATGEKIPPSVLRRTSGHIYSLTGEASILRDLGWSINQSTRFLWKQRKYFRDTKAQN